VPEIVPAVASQIGPVETGSPRSVHRGGRKPKPHLNSVHRRNNGRRIQAAANRGGGTKPEGTQAEGTEAVETKPGAAAGTEAAGTQVEGIAAEAGTPREDNGSSPNLKHRRSQIQTVEATRVLPGSGGLLYF
jgi:hypothetical protein